MGGEQANKQVASRKAGTIVYRVARRLAANALKESDPMAATFVLRAALQLLRDGFDPSGLDDDNVEVHVIDTTWRLLGDQLDPNPAADSSSSNRGDPVIAALTSISENGSLKESNPTG